VAIAAIADIPVLCDLKRVDVLLIGGANRVGDHAEMLI